MAFQDEAFAVRQRLHLGKMRPPMLIGTAVVAVLVVGALAVAASGAMSGDGFAVTKDEGTMAVEDEASAAGEAVARPQVCVHVSGAVARSDVYFLDEGSRVADAVVAAGGFTDEAAVDGVNLARVLNDGEQIAVPTLDAVADAGASAAMGQSQDPSPAASGTAGLVNINTADSAALQSLDGIGEATAKKIIADREANGPFRTIEDLKRVTGIGDKKLANLRDRICV